MARVVFSELGFHGQRDSQLRGDHDARHLVAPSPTVSFLALPHVSRRVKAPAHLGQGPLAYSAQVTPQRCHDAVARDVVLAALVLARDVGQAHLGPGHLLSGDGGVLKECSLAAERANFRLFDS